MRLWQLYVVTVLLIGLLVGGAMFLSWKVKNGAAAGLDREACEMVAPVAKPTDAECRALLEHIGRRQ
jgi:hypothetical protein